MKPNAIVYTSNAGHTAEYAHLLGKKTNLPVYSLAEAKKRLPAGNDIIYLGWLMAGKVKGYASAAKRYHICVLCPVGMAAAGTQLEDVRKNNSVSETLPVFTLQGGFEIEKLSGIYKLMMTVMTKTAGKSLADKAERTPEEDDMLDMLLHGGSRVSLEGLGEVLDWYRSAE